MFTSSLKPVIFFIVLAIFLVCTFFMMQGMLPYNDNLDWQIETGHGKTSKHLHSDKLRITKTQSPTKFVSTSVAANAMSSPNISKINLLAHNLPDQLKTQALSVKVVERNVLIDTANVFHLEALPPDGVVHTNQTALLLHGMKFTSETWLKLSTIQLLAAMGHRVIAVDLPGYGKTAGNQPKLEKRGPFLNALLEALSIKDPIIISPSMSGTYSLPYLFLFLGKMGGYVPVAPVFTDKYTKAEYEAVQTPTLIIYGELDDQLGAQSTGNLRNIPNSQVHKLPKAGHPAYLDQPQLFHQLLYNFFLALKK